MASSSPQPKANASDATSGSASAFELLHPGVQRQLWRMGWTKLRPLQVESIRYLLQSLDDLLLCAATASGKTEAAFLPVLSKIADKPVGSVRAMYIGPLKALINDQFGRVGELCEYLEVPVHSWHGDVSASKKAKLVQDPGGVLLITPESLESLFVNRSEHLSRLFGGLRFVVIDELHSFLDNERGMHLQSLLARVRHICGQSAPFRRIALSATVGEISMAQRYVNPDRPESVRVVDDTSGKKELKLRIHGYRSIPAGDEDDVDEQGENVKPSDAVLRMSTDIVKHCAGAANLIFANAKADVEECADLCKEIAQQQGLADQFLVHHGSLSAEIREDAEATMKSGVVATTFCSSTLEMGVDIGSVKMVGQISAPWSVASLKQRLGRSGRKEGEPRVLRMYVRCREPDAHSDVFDRVHLHLLQAIGVTELMLSGWVEPPSPPRCDLSTLTQQIISVVAQTGGTRADWLYDQLCICGAFRDIDKKLFASLLRCLARNDVIEQMGDSEGDLILGLRGEKIRKDRGFYAVFATPQQYGVLHEGRRIGTLECVPEKDEHLLFAGRRWQVADVDRERLELHVVPARGWKRPKFMGATGHIHPRIREKMREVLGGHMELGYLDAESHKLLDEARAAAATAGICQRPLVALGPRKTALMTWTGTRIQQTMCAQFAELGVGGDDEQIAIVFDLTERDVVDAILLGPRAEQDLQAVARRWEPRQRRKYDSLLDDALLDACIIRDQLDLEGASATLGALQRLCASSSVQR